MADMSKKQNPKRRKVITNMPSLKVFHIFCMIVSFLLFVFFGYWSFINNFMSYLYLSCVLALVIGIYGFSFFKTLYDY